MVLEAVGPYLVHRKVHATILGVQYVAPPRDDQWLAVIRILTLEYAKEPCLLKGATTETSATAAIEHLGSSSARRGHPLKKSAGARPQLRQEHIRNAK